MTLEKTTSYGTKIKYFYSESNNSPFDNFDIIEKKLNEIFNNINSFVSSTLFSKLTIEIWDTTRPDTPAIKQYSGLTYPSSSLIQINTNTSEIDKEKFFSNALSHELGHWFAYNAGFDDRQNNLRIMWDGLRGKSQEVIIIPGELIAEDFRLLFGSNKAKNFERGEYLQATRVKGLKGLMKIWSDFTEYKKNLQSRQITSISSHLSEDKDYFGLMVTDRHNIFFWQYTTYFFDNNGIQKYNYFTKTWKIIKSYE